jgi:hypothetical protein
MKSHIAIQPRHRYQAGREQADDDRATDQVRFVKMRAQQSAQSAGSEQDEHGGEAENETEAQAKCATCPLEACPAARKPIRADRAPGDIRDLAGHERQDARRQKRNHARGKCRGYADAGGVHYGSTSVTA